MGILVIEMIDTSPPYMEDEYYSRAPLQVSEDCFCLTFPSFIG